MNQVPSVTYWGWEAETSTLTIFSRDAREVLWKSKLASFQEAKDCADAFDKIHRSGI